MDHKMKMRLMAVAVVVPFVAVLLVATLTYGGETGPPTPYVPETRYPQPGMYYYAVYKVADGRVVVLAPVVVGSGGYVVPGPDEAVLNITDHPDLKHVYDDAYAGVLNDHWYVDVSTDARSIRHK